MKLAIIRTTEKTTDAGLFILRMFLGGAMFFGHGVGKWQRLFSDAEIQFSDPFGIGAVPSLIMAVFAEVICSLLVMFGLLTRWALVPLVITMLVAIFYEHISDDFRIMEKAILYGAGFVTLFFTGPGRYSLDYLLKKNK